MPLAARVEPTGQVGGASFQQAGGGSAWTRFAPAPLGAMRRTGGAEQAGGLTRGPCPSGR